MPQAKKKSSSTRVSKSVKGVRGSAALKSRAKGAMEWSSGSCAQPTRAAKSSTGTRQSKSSRSTKSLASKARVKG